MQPPRTIEEAHAAFQREIPRLIIERNIHGIDIDPRCTQIAGLSLWLRAQKSWQRLGIAPMERMRITRSNIVCAEPMPGEKELLREFVEAAFSGVERTAFAFLLERIFDRMTLAGDAGSLLRIEEEIRAAVADARAVAQYHSTPRQAVLFADVEPKEQVEFDLRGLTEEQFWQQAEERIYDALRAYAEQAQGEGGFQRRLFADDAAHGFAFIDLCRKRYDVVVMNPPFGDSSEVAKSYIDKNYPNSSQDLFAAFVERAVTSNIECGFIGVISTEAGFFRRTLQSWRQSVLLGQSTLSVMAHLGGHVLDGATVRTAIYALEVPKREGTSIFLRLLGYEGRQNRLADSVEGLTKGQPYPGTYQTDQTEFEKLPYAVFGYWCSPELRNAFATLPTLETKARVRQGLATGDDFRFLRLRWELQPLSVGHGGNWLMFAKGGEYSPYYDDIHLALNWADNGKELIACGIGRPQNTQFFGMSGLTYPRRTNKRFAPRAMPAGCAFGDKGPGIFKVDGSQMALLALLNSRPVSHLLGLALGASEAEGGAGANSYEVGLVQRLPVPGFALKDQALENLGRKAWKARFAADQDDETKATFLAPFGTNETFRATALAHKNRIIELVKDYCDTQTAIDARARELYRFSESDWTEILEQVGDIHRPEIAPTLAFENQLAASAIQYAVGCALGRWDIRYATGERPAPDLPDPLAPLPVCPPGMLQNADGLPLSPEEGRRLRAEGSFPLDVAWDGILVDDPEHPLDLARRVHAALQVLFGDRTDNLEQEAIALLGVSKLREWFRRPTGFFADHLKRYSKSRRQAPIYWPLSTASGSYTLWIYYHRLTPDTLYQTLQKFIAPKLAEVEKFVLHLRAVVAANEGGSKERKQLEELETFRRELHDFRTELERLAPLWKPNLSDGVQITASPLWRLFLLPKWRKTLEETWGALKRGDYDWAHLALTLRPNEVREKCRTDRSLAIAHGLEELCEINQKDFGKKKRRKKKDEE